MKQCPSCRTTYTDESLRYCLADGTVLDSLTDEQSTVIRTSGPHVADETVAFSDRTAAFGKEIPHRVEIPTAKTHTTTHVEQPTAFGSAVPSPTAGGSSSGIVLKIVMAVVALAIIGVLLLAIAGGVFYFSSGKGEIPVNTANTKQMPANSPSPAWDDRDELRDQIANLEKRLDEQKRAGQTANVPLKMPNRSTTSSAARVDSPGDGFLALRSLPSSEQGDRILKIPHGATVSVGACGPVIAPVKRRGRWCQASYGGYDGWVFDAYLVY